MNMQPSRRAERANLKTVDDSRCVSLTRASTKEQLLTLEAQPRSIRSYCELKSWQVIQEFEDADTSGKSSFLDRPVVRAMLTFMQKERINQIVCTRLDRAFRSTADAIYTIDQLYRHGVGLHFCEQNIDPTTPSGKAMFQMLAVFAEFETDVRRARQLEAFDQQRVLHQKSGVNIPYGWRAVASPGRLTRERRQAFDLIPDLEQQEVLGQMIRRRNAGDSDDAIATVLNFAEIPTAKAGQMIKYRGKLMPCSGKWSARTVHSILSFARLADDRLASTNTDDVEESLEELGQCPLISP